MRQAYKVAYLGSGFYGSQRQPDVRTVEGDLLAAFLDEGVFENPQQAQFEMASRTDREVSALGNVTAFDSSWDPREVIATVNPRLEGIWLHAYATPGADFRPRRACERWYRYHYPRSLDRGRLESAARLFLGTHDFRSFARGKGGVCTIRAIEAVKRGDWTLLDVRGDRFRWQMVRRIAGALEAHCEGRLTEASLLRALEGGRLGTSPAPGRYLVLVDVRYGFDFRPFLQPTLPAVREAERLRRLEEMVLEALRTRLARFAGDSDPGG